MECAPRSYPTLTACQFDSNVGDVMGGAVRCVCSYPRLIDCTLTDNAGTRGAAIYCYESFPVLDGCTIAGGSSSQGCGMRSLARDRCGGWMER